MEGLRRYGGMRVASGGVEEVWRDENGEVEGV